MDSQLLREALNIGLDCARAYADDCHAKLKGYRPETHKRVDEDVRKIEAAVAIIDMSMSATHDKNVFSNCAIIDTSDPALVWGEQNLAKTDPALVFQLIQRHADNPQEAGAMMESWAKAWHSKDDNGKN